MLVLELRGVDRALELLQRAPREVRTQLNASVRRAVSLVKRSVQAQAPRFTGTLRRRIKMRTGTVGGVVVRGVVRAAAPHAHLVERGRRPGRMPSAADPRFASYAQRLGVHPFVLARAIGRQGTRPHPFFDPAVRGAVPEVQRELESALRRILEQLRR